MDQIISAVRHRISVPENVTSMGPSELFPVATQHDVLAAENALGFPLPPLLRRLYLELANGGFGPGYGLSGVGGRGTDEGSNDIVELFRSQSTKHWSLSFPNWPPRILRIAYFGCAMHAAIECSKPEYPVYLFDPSDDEAHIGFANCLIPFECEFNEWILQWATGKEVDVPPAYVDP